MDQFENAMGMLDLMIHSGFCVKDNKIIKVNPGAQRHLISEGMDVSSLLATGKEEYAAFQGGCLYLTLSLGGSACGASVTRMDDFDVFILEQEADQQELQAMALAAQELRSPLTSIMTTAHQLFPLAASQNDPTTAEQIARLNRGLFQMLRVISNMSDAGRYHTTQTLRAETRELRAFFGEIFERAATLISHAGLSLCFTNLDEPLLCLADGEKLERAVLNILSNAIKFAPKGGKIDARLSQRGNKLYISVQDNGQGIPEQLRGSVHNRFLRQPGIEDSRFGIGLGMVLIRSTAAAHGGTVLIDQPEGIGTRITMSMEIRQDSTTTLRSPMLHVDYAGEQDHGLMELSETLPTSLYEWNP